MSFEQFEQTYRARLNDTDYSTARADLVRVKEAATNPLTLANLDGVATTGKRLGAMFGIDMKSGSKEGARFMQEFQESVQLIQQSTGQNLSQLELRDLAANLAMKTVEQYRAYFPDPDISVYQLMGMDMSDLTVPEQIKNINAMTYQKEVDGQWAQSTTKPLEYARRLKARSLKGEDGPEPTEAEVAKVTDEQAINAWIHLIRLNKVRLID